MKAVLFLAAVLTASGLSQVEEATCALDGAKAASEISDVIVYLWAATQRCNTPKGNQRAPKCVVDIAAAIEAVNNMVMIIVKAVNDCTKLSTENYGCGMAVGGLTGTSAGLAKAGAEILHYCPQTGFPTSQEPTPEGIDEGGLTTVGKCVVNVKAATEGLFKATLEASKIHGSCEGNSVQCSRDALHLVAAVGDMGASIGAGITHCEAASGRPGNAAAACGAAIIEAVAAITKVTDAAVGIHQQCIVTQSRLFELDDAEEQSKNRLMPTLAVAAMVPVLLAVGFVAGSQFRSSAAGQGYKKPTAGFQEDLSVEVSMLASESDPREMISGLRSI
jgi:hypothetical protein